MGIREIIALVFLAAGLFFLIASAIGMLRLPDFYTRLHASGNSETLGLIDVYKRQKYMRAMATAARCAIAHATFKCTT